MSNNSYKKYVRAAQKSIETETTQCVHLRPNGECSLYQDADKRNNPDGCDYLGYCAVTNDFSECFKAMRPTYE